MVARYNYNLSAFFYVNIHIRDVDSVMLVIPLHDVKRAPFFFFKNILTEEHKHWCLETQLHVRNRMKNDQR